MEKLRSIEIKKLLSILFISILCIHSEDQKLYFMRHFLIIEAKDSSQELRKKAFQNIIKYGTKAIPLIKERLRQTRNKHYFYLLQKLKGKQKKENWNKQYYFKKKFILGKKLLKNRQIRKARKIFEAILALEPNIYLKNDIKESISKCKDLSFSTTTLMGTISTYKKYYSHGENITVVFTLKNNLRTSIHVVGKSGIVAKILVREIYINGNFKEKSFTKIVSLDENMNFTPQERKKYKLILANKKPKITVYREIEILAYIPRCMVKQEAKTWYPSIQFDKVIVSSLPSIFKKVARKPLTISMKAIEFHYPINLFFASFFLNKREKIQMIPYLIKAMNSSNIVTQKVSLGILKRITGKNYILQSQWQSWWTAKKTILEIERENK